MVSLVAEKGGMARLTISAGQLVEDTKVGDSVSVNGVCLTVNEVDGESLVFYAMPETLRRTALGGLKKDDIVNLDGVGEVLAISSEGGAEIWEFSAPEAVLRYAVEKGSVCLDGISLTLVSVRESSFTVSILPQTKEATNLRSLSLGDRVNLEADVIAKYVERLLGPRLGVSSQTSERSVEDAV
jgi:riboflavin synthase